MAFNVHSADLCSFLKVWIISISSSSAFEFVFKPLVYLIKHPANMCSKQTSSMNSNDLVYSYGQKTPPPPPPPNKLFSDQNFHSLSDLECFVVVAFPLHHWETLCFWTVLIHLSVVLNFPVQPVLHGICVAQQQLV